MMLSPLVKIDVAAYVLNKSYRQIFDLVDGGSRHEAGLLWVFNMATNPRGHRRDLRFWVPEIQARAKGDATKYHKQELGWVIAQMLSGNRRSFHGGQVSELFQVRHNTRLDYGTQLPSRRHSCGNTYERPAIERFLRQRWIGVAASTRKSGETGQDEFCAGRAPVKKEGEGSGFSNSPAPAAIKCDLNWAKSMSESVQANPAT